MLKPTFNIVNIIQSYHQLRTLQHSEPSVVIITSLWQRKTVKFIQSHDIPHNVIQHNDTKHKELICDTKRK